MTSNVACDDSMVNSPPHQLRPTHPTTYLACLHRVLSHGSVSVGLGIAILDFTLLHVVKLANDIRQPDI